MPDYPLSYRPGLRLLIMLFLMITFCSHPVIGETFRVNTGFTPPVSTLFKAVVGEALTRLGHSMEFQVQSAERSLTLVASGGSDIECCRIPVVIARDYPQLLVVDEPIYEARFVAFVRDPSIRIGRWEEMKPYHIATVTGWKILVQRQAELQPRRGWVLDDPVALFQMLDAGRVEVATLGYASGLKHIRDLEMADRIRPAGPPLEREPLYLILAPHHQALANQLKTTLAEMRRDGTLAALTRQHLDSLKE